MKLKHIITILITITFVNITQAQKIKIKKGVIYIDDEKCLTTDGDPLNISFYDLEGDEIVFMKYLDDKRDGESYMRVTFLSQKKSFTSKSILFTKKMLIRRLLDTKTIDNCMLNEDKVDRFILKYDEDIESDDINVNISIDRN
ncbi:hypothetical protein [Hanstruepera marina]|uniref:hypothetical protein n=1 Tax=Hanstruepera marina TaxID=2873265 RepID=UPI001CA6F974|nr:hypothetical protein [Hanstruepera marina]